MIMDNFYFDTSFLYYTPEMYEKMGYYDPNETDEERLQRATISAIVSFICLIGVPLLLAVCYGIYKLIVCL